MWVEQTIKDLKTQLLTHQKQKQLRKYLLIFTIVIFFISFFGFLISVSEFGTKKEYEMKQIKDID